MKTLNLTFEDKDFEKMKKKKDKLKLTWEKFFLKNGK
jgi:hypothetical protein